MCNAWLGGGQIGARTGMGCNCGDLCTKYWCSILIFVIVCAACVIVGGLQNLGTFYLKCRVMHCFFNAAANVRDLGIPQLFTICLTEQIVYERTGSAAAKKNMGSKDALNKIVRAGATGENVGDAEGGSL